MIRVIKITKHCEGCMGGAFNDCPDCEDKCQEVVLCKDCNHKNENVMHREKLLCTKLHAWVEPYEFCAWGEREVTE